MSATALYVGVNGLAQKVFDSSDFGNLFDSAIDENNKLYSSPSITNFRDTPASYTATEDCYVYMSYWGSVGTNMYPRLNGKLIGPGALQGNKAMVLLPIKKGDTISHRHDATMNESCFVQFEVYGRKPAAVSHDYSTTEQKVGTWIDGKTLYEKTKVFNFSDLTHMGNLYYARIQDSGENLKYVTSAYAYSETYGWTYLGCLNYTQNNDSGKWWQLNMYYDNICLTFSGSGAATASGISVSKIVVTYQYTKS